MIPNTIDPSCLNKVPFSTLATCIDNDSFPVRMKTRTDIKEDEDNNLRSEGSAVNLAREF